MVINARSLVKPDAAAALYTESCTNKIDLCFVSETWLNSKVASSLICPDGYRIVRKDRYDLRTGGGVAIACRNDCGKSRGHRVLDVLLNNCPHIWKPPVVLNGLVRSDHFAVMTTRFVARPDRSFVYFVVVETLLRMSSAT